MDRKRDCIFCKSKFYEDYQLISAAPKHWLFISNRDPHTDYHCLIVLKAEVVEKNGHISDLSDDNIEKLPKKALQDLGVLLKKACRSIKACDPYSIEKILIVSLNTGEGSQHLHFHLIPKRCNEPIKKVNNPCRDGGGMFFLARKEIVRDTFFDFLGSTVGSKSKELISKIKKATEEKVKHNTEEIKKNFRWR